jgi:hypothetical protein
MSVHRILQLWESDLVFRHTTDPAFMAVLDMAHYESFLPDWDWPKLKAKVAQQMTQERIFAWGCPEYDLQIRITGTPPAGPDFHPVESIPGFLNTAGRLCFTSFDSVAMCAQFEDRHFPGDEDRPFSTSPGRYEIVVHRMFEWRHGEQFPDVISAGDHYVIAITPASLTSPPKEFDTVPWAV